MARIGILALLISALVGACASPPGGGSVSPSVGINDSPSSMASSPPPVGPFPSEIAGLPVISVATADELLRSGKVDGQAVAVAGYFDQFTPSCPYPSRYIGPLEAWCHVASFTDTRASAKLCQPEGANGMSCHQPSGTSLSPWFMTETSAGSWAWVSAGATGEPAALVLIGHAGDPRQWQCTAAAQAQCADAFVVDRVAWVNGSEVPPTAPQTGEQLSGKVITPVMTLDQVAAAVGLGDDLVTGAAFRRGDVATIDPRWNLAGDDIVWLLRSLGQADGSGAPETRPETVWLLDDATGKVIDSQPLELAADYRPARMWPMATVHGVECCAGDVFPFYRVASGDGTAVYEGVVSSSASGDADATTYGGTYGSGLLVLPPGDYAISVWLTGYAAGVTGPPRNECSTRVTLQSLGDIALNADFPPNGACTLRPAPVPTPMPGAARVDPGAAAAGAAGRGRPGLAAGRGDAVVGSWDRANTGRSTETRARHRRPRALDA